MLKPPKKFIRANVVGSVTISTCIFHGHENIENQFPEDRKISTTHEKN